MPGDTARENGKRGGRPKGRRSDATLEKEAAREAYREAVGKHVEAIIKAQVAQATGLPFLVVRDRKTGRFRGRVRSQAQFDKAIKDDALEVLEVWAKEPNPQAQTDILNRYLDKPKEQEVDVNVRDSSKVIERLHKARARVAAAALVMKKTGKVLVPPMDTWPRSEE